VALDLRQTIAIGVVRAYQVVLSPMTGGACRFTPTCSAYAIEAIERHGAARGLWLAIKRLARCHPWGGFGDDPVPHDFAGHPAPETPAPTALGDRSLNC
jgi:putative membrane protein insertion efficiency factor